MENDFARSRTVVRAAVFFGGLWGIAEATLGYLLHLLPIVLPAPGISGAVMFPAGFLFMYAALRATGIDLSIPSTAIVAAAVKLASLAIPGVTFPFVRNPALAILAEGLVVFVAAETFSFRPNGLIVVKAYGISLGWRLLYLLASVILGIRGGILAKGTTAILTYLFLESAVNALLIGGLLLGVSAAGGKTAGWMKQLARSLRSLPMAGAALAGAAAVGAEVLFRVL